MASFIRRIKWTTRLDCRCQRALFLIPHLQLCTANCCSRIVARDGTEPSVNDSIGIVTMFGAANGCNTSDTSVTNFAFQAQFGVCYALAQGEVPVVSILAEQNYECANGRKAGIVFWTEDAGCAQTLDPKKLDSVFFVGGACTTRANNAGALSFKMGCIFEELGTLFPLNQDVQGPFPQEFTSARPAATTQQTTTTQQEASTQTTSVTQQSSIDGIEVDGFGSIAVSGLSEVPGSTTLQETSSTQGTSATRKSSAAGVEVNGFGSTSVSGLSEVPGSTSTGLSTSS
jgi:hypothetical protein